MTKRIKITLIAVAVATVIILSLTLGLIFGLRPHVPAKYARNWSADLPFDETCYQTLSIDSEELKVLQITDVHYDDHNNQKPWTLELIKHCIDTAQPDLIAVTGDWVSNNEAKERGVATRAVFDVIDSYGIPWIATFGNHDDEGELDKYEYADIFAEYENSMFEVGFTNLKGGAGNYIIVVEHDGKPQQAIVAMDTHSARKKWTTKYDWLGKDQIEWYKWAIDGVQKLYREAGGDGIIPSLNFQHIPVNEFAEHMYDNDKIVHGDINETDPPYSFPAIKNTGFFDALKEKGSSKGVFFGHDHANDRVIKLDGIYLGYGLQSGWCEGYAEDTKKGALSITIDSAGNVEFEQIIYPAPTK